MDFKDLDVKLEHLAKEGVAKEELKTSLFTEPEPEVANSGISISDIRNKAYSTLVVIEDSFAAMEGIKLPGPDLDFILRNDLSSMRDDMLGLLALTYGISEDDTITYSRFVMYASNSLRVNSETDVVPQSLHDKIITLLAEC